MTTAATSPPPGLEILDTEAIRRKLAGLADPLPRSTGSAEDAEIRDAASRLCSILASLFGGSLDRVTLWTKIDAALGAACARVADADLDRFVSLCLDTIKAEPARAAACGPLGAAIETFATRPAEWRHAFVEHIRHRRFAVVVHGRARWEKVKSGEVDL